MNPNGVFFGPNAKLEITGSFTVSTADYLELSDGGRFNASAPENSILTRAPIKSFGFLDAPADISIDQAVIDVLESRSLSIIGGDVQIVDGVIAAPDGEINILSLASEGELIYPPLISRPPSVVEGFEEYGTIKLLNSGEINVNGSAGGRVAIFGGDLSLNDAFISAHTKGDQNGFGIVIGLSGTMSLSDNSQILSNTSSIGNSGKISILSRNVEIIDSGIISNTSDLGNSGSIIVEAEEILVDGVGRGAGIFTQAGRNGGEGNAGNVSLINLSKLEILNGGVISTSSFGKGKGGELSIQASEILINGEGATNKGLATGILSESNDPAIGGSAGDLNLTGINNLKIINGARVSTMTRGHGHAGDISIEANCIQISGNQTGITTSSINDTQGGRAGDINLVEIQSLKISNNGVITSSTSNQSSGGAINIDAYEIVIDGYGAFAAITSFSGNRSESGKAGDITLSNLSSLRILNGGLIDSSTLGFGEGGNINIQASEILIDGNGIISGISSSSLSLNQGGNAGTINLNKVDKLILKDSGLISSDTFGEGAGGDITIEAQAVFIDGEKSPASISSGTNSKSDGGNGGNISLLNSKVLEILHGGFIEANTSGLGIAGDIEIKSDLIRIIGGEFPSFITSVSESNTFGGPAGDIIISNFTQLEISNQGFVSSATLGGGLGGTITIQGKEISIDGKGSSIQSQSNYQGEGGKAGDINLVEVTSLKVLDEAGISTATFGLGDGGNIFIGAEEILVDGKGIGASIFTITANSEDGGKAGDMTLENVENLSVIQGAEITASTFGLGNGGNISIQAKNIVIDGAGKVTGVFTASRNVQEGGSAGNIEIKNTNILNLINNGQITVEAERSDAGNIEIEVSRTLFLDDSKIKATAGFSGGNINIDPKFTVLNNSEISANAIEGSGGNIKIITDFLIQSDDSSITASSEFGLQGNVSISVPDLDLAGRIIPLKAGVLQKESQLPEHCAVRFPGEQSSIIQIGRGGLPWAPGLVQTSFEEWEWTIQKQSE